LRPRGDVLDCFPVEFKVNGPRRAPGLPPLWVADVVLRMWTTHTQRLETGWYSRGLRSLYVSAEPVTGVPGLPRPTLLPGTAIARCRILSVVVTVNDQPFTFVAPDGADATLLLQAENGDWTGEVLGTNPRVPRFTLKEAVCVGGQIPFGNFRQSPAPGGKIAWKKWFPDTFLRDISAPVLSSSGLAFDACAVLGWGPPPQAETVVNTAPYLLEVVIDRLDDGTLRRGQGGIARCLCHARQSDFAPAGRCGLRSTRWPAPVGEPRTRRPGKHPGVSLGRPVKAPRPRCDEPPCVRAGRLVASSQRPAGQPAGRHAAGRAVGEPRGVDRPGAGPLPDLCPDWSTDGG
jgi:hypothetical protein